jgi:hypothetical protein
MHETPHTGGYQTFQTITFGQLEVKQPGVCSLTITPVPAQWQPMNLRSIVLKPTS